MGLKSKYKVTAIMFSLDTYQPPFSIISDIDHYFSTKGCVIFLKAFCRDMYLCTLMGKEVVSKVQKCDQIVIGNQMLTYKVVDPEVTCIKIELPGWEVMKEEILQILRPYGNILVSDLDSKSSIPMFYAVMNLKRDIPTQLKNRYGLLDVKEFV